MVLIDALIFAAALFFLIKGSDYFVKAASAIARHLGVSEFVIGLTFVAVGTSLPELASSISASFLHQDELIIGNIVGSNIANIGIILGIAAIVAAIATRKDAVKMDGYLMLFSALLLALFAVDLLITRVEAIVFLLFYGGYIIYLFDKSEELKKEYNFKEYIWYILKFKTIKGAKRIIAGFFNGFNHTQKKIWKPLLKDFLLMAISGTAVIAGANFTVIKASLFAEMLNIPKEIIGLILIAIGTSLPELSVSIAAARAGKGQIAIGNIVGSNIANILLILGTAALIRPVSFGLEVLYFVLPVLIFLSVVLLLLIKYCTKITRTHGIFLVAFYVLFLIFLTLGVY